jgi:hypothetical protein
MSAYHDKKPEDQTAYSSSWQPSVNFANGPLAIVRRVFSDKTSTCCETASISAHAGSSCVTDDGLASIVVQDRRRAEESGDIKEQNLGMRVGCPKVVSVGVC